MFTDAHLLKTASGPIKDSKVEIVIVNEHTVLANGDELEWFRKENPHLKIVTYEELYKLGEELPVEAVPPKPEDLYCVMYTSGSTGMPKGACITQEAIVAGSKLARWSFNAVFPSSS